jgi:ribosome maturation factor RimP
LIGFKKGGLARLFCCRLKRLKMLNERIADLIAEPLKELGFEVVDVNITGSPVKTIQIFIDRLDGAKASVGDCSKVSRKISEAMDEAEVIDAKYFLEVSTPGIDRPLKKLADYQKYLGHKVKFQFNAPLVDNRRKASAKLKEISSDNKKIIIETDDKLLLEVEFNNIDSAKLVLTDELIAAKI